MTDSVPQPTYADGIRAIAPLGYAIGALGLVFGYLARAAGLTTAQATTMSAITFAGSPQFAAISVYSQGGTIAGALISAALLAARFAPMSATAAAGIKGPLWRRALFSQLVVDETWAISYAGGASFDRRILVGAGLALYVVHVTATAIGAAAGDLIGNAEALGVDAMSPALFVVLLKPHIAQRQGWIAAIMAAITALLATPFAPPGIPLLVGAIAGVGASAYSSDRRQSRSKSEQSK